MAEPAEDPQLTDSEEDAIDAPDEDAEAEPRAAPDGGPPPKRTRTDAEFLRRERSLGEFLAEMDKYAPIIPDAVTDYYLARAGFNCDDVRIKRLLALAAQKFIADIATDALQHCRMRQASANRDRRGGAKEKKLVLTMEEVTAALADRGISVAKPDLYR
ncbi:transcription initiation factor IID TAF10 subunit [Hyaloraphidium curvatum]|nr:transcription initiation factor IID TAF10 subunit [Hyaloraphidium curvatum]